MAPNGPPGSSPLFSSSLCRSFLALVHFFLHVNSLLHPALRRHQLAFRHCWALAFAMAVSCHRCQLDGCWCWHSGIAGWDAFGHIWMQRSGVVLGACSAKSFSGHGERFYVYMHPWHVSVTNAGPGQEVQPHPTLCTCMVRPHCRLPQAHEMMVRVLFAQNGVNILSSAQSSLHDPSRCAGTCQALGMWYP